MGAAGIRRPAAAGSGHDRARCLLATRPWIALPALLLAAGVASAATGLAFLKISADASSSALGENTAAGWRDALSPVGNPALAPADGRTHVALTQADWIFDSRYTAMAVSAPPWAPGRRAPTCACSAPTASSCATAPTPTPRASSASPTLPSASACRGRWRSGCAWERR